MDEISLQSNFKVELVDIAGSDELICKAARVSTLGADSIDTKESTGLLRFLMRNRHGSPFEHGLLMFRIQAPIFVWREFMRHRIGFSYNEQSGRYMEMEPRFYIPPIHRNLVQVGKPGAYDFVPGSEHQIEFTTESLYEAYRIAWENYQAMLKMQVAKEVARMCLPVAIYSTAYVTCNPRSLMAFLSLRTRNEGSLFPSYPQWEISQVADQMEAIFKDEFAFPITWAAFNENGRVSP